MGERKFQVLQLRLKFLEGLVRKEVFGGGGASMDDECLNEGSRRWPALWTGSCQNGVLRASYPWIQRSGRLRAGFWLPDTSHGGGFLGGQTHTG